MGQEKANTGLFSWQKRQLFTGKSWNGAGEREKQDDKGPTNGFFGRGLVGKRRVGRELERDIRTDKKWQKTGFLEEGWKGMRVGRGLDEKIGNGSSANSLPTFSVQ